MFDGVTFGVTLCILFSSLIRNNIFNIPIIRITTLIVAHLGRCLHKVCIAFPILYFILQYKFWLVVIVFSTVPTDNNGLPFNIFTINFHSQTSRNFHFIVHPQWCTTIPNRNGAIDSIVFTTCFTVCLAFLRGVPIVLNVFTIFTVRRGSLWSILCCRTIFT